MTSRSDGQQDLERVQAIIRGLPDHSRHRVLVIAEILRDLINRPGDEGQESELAFTLVLAERTAS